LQTARRCDVHSFKSIDTGRIHENSKAINQNLAYRKIKPHSNDTLSLRGVTHADKSLHLPPLHIQRTEHIGHTDGSRSGVRIFFRVVILVFAATCCTARVIGKALHTGHWYIR